ncbi:family 43 glycosylhydrolase [Paenibacillus silvisoli]|uniref:family 43 glycosylhydrolase n=1 Tax=Paenibacillus silvisoli TaxID=3110539 RepID=UPI0028048431|nr:family 43 glycosylhydrolase [Paenibacillus silvisoli]
MKPTATYCNPLPLPDYQRGPASMHKGSKDSKWLHDVHRDFREMADPSVVRFKDRWYLFPSYGLIWYSDDMLNWHYQPVEPFVKSLDLVAPTAVEKDGYLYMAACSDELWRTTDPLGEWELVGTLKDENGNPTSWKDPMLFVDDDGSMYCYHGLGADGIYVVKLRDDDYTRFDGQKAHCFAFNPDHVWERFGECNQDPGISYIEGSWMTKRGGRYYLLYSAPGTEYKRYSLGCYTSDGPMGPFTYQDNSPILHDKGGLINGSGHHSIVEGPDGNLWCFYTILVRIEYKFERRIAMDPVGFDEDGRIFIAGPSETPQFAPGVKGKPWTENDTGLLPLTVNESVKASSYAPGHEPVYAIDNYIRTWWEAADSSTAQWIAVELGREYEVCSARTLFADRGLDYDGGVVPGPYKYRIEGSLNGEEWFTLIDKSDNTVDQHIVYDAWNPHRARYVRLFILAAPRGMRMGVWEFTAFGRV